MSQSPGALTTPTLRVVLDTNVIVSGLLLPGSKPRRAFDRTLTQGRILLSDDTMTELYQVLNRKRLRQYIDDRDIRSFLIALTREGEWVDVNVHLTACRDPKDNKFLELAISGRATHLVTGDSDLLVLNPFQGVTILSPVSFVELPPPPGLALDV